jgi:serine/threonine protein kinase
LPTKEKVRTFQFLKEIAAGGFGSVYLTKISHPDGFSRLTAVKLMHRRWSDNEEISRRMRDEARLLGWLRHRNIVDVVDLTSLDGRTAIIMEYLEAVDLKQIIRACKESGERFPLQAVFQIMQAASSALDAAYNRPPYAGEKPLCVIHRDIKPSNIMVDDSGHVKVLDFGVARADFAERESQTRELQFGSVDYMPPERLLFEPESPGSDVYSLASTGFEMMCLEKFGKAKGSPLKHEAYVAERIERLRAHLSLSGELGDAIAQLLSDCLSYESSDRPDAAQVVSRCRWLAREMGGLNLAEWSEINVPAMLNEASLEEPTSMNPLTGRTYKEDTVSYLGPPASISAETLQPPEDTVSDFDPRWASLRDAAASEMDPSGEELATEDSEVTSTEDGLGPSLSASLTLGGSESDFDDMDEVATTMIARPKKVEEEVEEEEVDEEEVDEEEVDEEEVDEEEFDEEESATRILSVDEIDAVSSASAEIRTAPANELEEEDGDGATMMLSDDTKNLLGGEALLGDRKPQPEEAPPGLAESPVSSGESIGSETILVHSGPTHRRSVTTGSVQISSTKRFLLSTMIFLGALGAGLGLGSALFYDELYGEGGVISTLFSSGESDSESDSKMALPGPIGGTEQAAADGEVSPEEPGATADEVVVRSLMEGTRKLIVRCGRDQFSGKTEVRFPVPDASECTVKAMTASSRMSVKIEVSSVGEIKCFSNGEKRCE